MENELEKIENELDKLGEQKSKGASITMTAIGGGSAIVGFALSFAGLIYILVGNGLTKVLKPEELPINVFTPVGIALLVIGLVLLVSGIILLIVGITNLKKVVAFNRKVEALENKRNRLLEEQKPNVQSPQLDEDTLLKLLSEGKISVAEYKKLSKK